MDQFSYLSILISLIIGLAIAQVLTGIGRLVQARARVVFYYPSVIWAVLLLLVDTETWWSLFRLRTEGTWNFFSFLIVIAHPVGLFLMCSLVLPDPNEFSRPTPVDLKANYFDHRRWFYGLILGVSVARLLRPLVTTDPPLGPVDIVSQVVIMVAAAVAAVTPREWVHRALAPLALLFMLAYYAQAYLKLT